MKDEVLRNDWIVVCKEEDVKEQPLQQIVLGERIVLFRNRKGIHAFKDLCIHRGAALSLGCVKDDQLVCPYHGWQYDDEGHCTKIPQLPEGKQISQKAQAFKYGCKVAYGFVWVNLNNNNLISSHMKKLRAVSSVMYYGDHNLWKQNHHVL